MFTKGTVQPDGPPCTCTVETAYKVAICPRGYLLNILYSLWDLLNNRPKVILERYIWA